ncbi:MAG: DUF4375 domain-containing protein [Anaerolineales bacterium]|jgi:hypothetical protein
MCKRKEKNPYDELWISLVKRVHRTKRGFYKLNEDEKTYYLLNLFEGSVYNGGMYGYFSNTSGNLYEELIEVLKRENLIQALELLINAKNILFDEATPPKDHWERNLLMKQLPKDNNMPKPEWDIELEEIETEFYKNSDGLIDFMVKFADEKGLIQKYRYSKIQRIKNFFTSFLWCKKPKI